MEPKKSYSLTAPLNAFIQMDLKKASLQMERFRELIWMEPRPLHILTGKSKHINQHNNRFKIDF